MIIINIDTKNKIIKVDTKSKIDNGGAGSGIKGHTTPREEKDKRSKGYFTSSISNFGTRYDDLKGKEAIDKLLQEKDGWCPHAFYRNDIGNVALIWGNEKVGLCHIMNRREKTNQDINSLLNNLSGVIENGKLTFNSATNRFELRNDKYIAVVDITKDEEKINFLLTAFEEYK